MADSTPSKHFTNGGHDVSEDLTKAERDAIVHKALDSRSSDDITRAGQGETERQELINSILATNKRREVIEFSLPINGPSSPRMRRRSLHPSDERSARDPRDQAKTSASGSAPRPEGPYTKFPTVDFDGLSWPSAGTRARLESTPEEAEARLQKLTGAVKAILECVGEDPAREGLLETPERFARAIMFFTKGYEENLRDIVNGAVFHEDHDELVIVKDIEIFSLCEHHLVPFTGKMHIGYIPRRRVIGLSKLARIAEMFARRLQVQERLTKQVGLALQEVLEPMGVAVVVESSHLCMVMRGVEKTNSKTITSCMLGCMRSPGAKTREEFLKLIRN